jgi:arginase
VTDGRRVAIIGAELDLGAGRRGVDMGPSAIRYAELGERLASIDIASEDWGNVHTDIRETADPGGRDARFLTQIREACERIAEQVRAAADGGLTPLVLGGDHSVAIGTIGALASLHGAGGSWSPRAACSVRWSWSRSIRSSTTRTQRHDWRSSSPRARSAPASSS